MATRTALFCLCPAGKGALEVRQVPRRHPAAGEVEIAVEAAGFGERSAWKELTPISEGFYGMGRFPVTLYKEQWLKLLDMSDDIRAFIAANEVQLLRS